MGELGVGRCCVRVRCRRCCVRVRCREMLCEG